MPRAYPKSLLYLPLRRGGLGAPHLQPRLELRFNLGALQCLNSRNALVRRSTRALWMDPQMAKVLDNDVEILRQHLGVIGLSVSLPPHGLLHKAPLCADVRRPYLGGHVVLISDGSAPDGRLGWGAVVADGDGVLAATQGGMLVDRPTSWAAEWHGKLAAVRLAVAIGVPAARWSWCIADNVAASLGADGGRPSRSVYLDKLRIGQAAAAVSRRPPCCAVRP